MDKKSFQNGLGGWLEEAWESLRRHSDIRMKRSAKEIAKNFRFGSVLGSLWGSPGAAKTLHCLAAVVQNQILGYIDDDMV